MQIVRVLIEEDTKDAKEEDMDEEEEEDMMVVAEQYLSSLTVVKQATYRAYVPNHAHFANISTTYIMSWNISQTCWKNGKIKRDTAIAERHEGQNLKE